MESTAGNNKEVNVRANIIEKIEKTTIHPDTDAWLCKVFYIKDSGFVYDNIKIPADEVELSLFLANEIEGLVDDKTFNKLCELIEDYGMENYVKGMNEAMYEERG